MASMLHPQYRTPSLILAALPLLLCGGALAFNALQFDASISRSVSRTDGCLVAWVSTRGGVIASPCHTNGGGWAAPQYDSRGIVGFSSATGTASPISFPLTETGLVSRAFIVADGYAATYCSTLLDAPCPLRLMQPEEDGAVHFVTSSVLSSVALSIDFEASTEFSTGPHLYEMELAAPSPLCDLYIGGSPATPAWNRNWNGTVREAILVSPSATAADAAAIRAYLSKRHGIGRYRSGVQDERATLHALGIKTGGVYGSMLIMR